MKPDKSEVLSGNNTVEPPRDRTGSSIGRVGQRVEPIRSSQVEIQQEDLSEKKHDRRPCHQGSHRVSEETSLKESECVRFRERDEKQESLRLEFYDLIEKFKNYEGQGDVKRARLVLYEIANMILASHNPKLKQGVERLILDYDKRVEALEQEDRRRLEAQRIREEEERKEFEEKVRLRRLSTERKEDWQSFEEVLRDNKITCLYHFTDKRNIPSIKQCGGLFSWDYCERNNITIPYQGGDPLSKDLDKRHRLEDYVRLSFCSDHPMIYRLEKNGAQITILKVKVDVVYLKETLFSNLNATDSLHLHGSDIEDLRRVNFEATKKTYIKKEDPLFKPHQAEVMVKTFIPLKYIINIDEV